MPGFRALTSALAAAACAAGLAACGGDDESGPIPTDRGNQLIDQLDEIQRTVEDGDCDRARDLAVSFATDVDALPLGEEDDELREALVSASGNLEALTDDPEECQPATGASGLTGTVPTTEATTPTTTEPTTPTTTEEPQDDEEGNGPPDEPPGGGNGDPGGGNGNDGGGSGGDESGGGIGSDG